MDRVGEIGRDSPLELVASVSWTFNLGFFCSQTTASRGNKIKKKAVCVLIEPNHKVIKTEYWELLPVKEEPYAGRSGSRELCAVTGARSHCTGALGSPWKHAHNERLQQHLLPPSGCSRVRCPNCRSAGGCHCPGHFGSVTAAFIRFEVFA